jgi:hypothetical protein
MSDRAAMDAVAQFFRGKQAIRRAEATSWWQTTRSLLMRAQILRDQHIAALLPPWSS